MSSQPTIKDVARLAGVSIGTVDRVLHNRGRVSPANQAAVNRAIETLHYHPSQVARALSIQKKNFKIGVSCPFVEEYFWTDAKSGVLTAAAQLEKFGVEVILDHYSSYAADDQRHSIERLLSRGVNALAMTPARDSVELLNTLIPEDIVFCTVIDDCPDSRRLFHVGPDDYAMGQTLARLAMLYRPAGLHCAVIAPNMHLEGTVKRLAGFQDRLKEENQADSLLEICPIEGFTEKQSYDNIYEKTLSLASVYPQLNAIYVTNGLTQWAASALLKIKKQTEIQVFGHEYTSMTEDFVLSGAITATVYQKPAQQWHQAITLLSEYLMQEREAPTGNIYTECAIITRESLPLLGTLPFRYRGSGTFRE